MNRRLAGLRPNRRLHRRGHRPPQRRGLGLRRCREAAIFTPTPFGFASPDRQEAPCQSLNVRRTLAELLAEAEASGVYPLPAELCANVGMWELTR
jgi:hypothetical protein